MSEIQRFYSGRNVFVTGGTGFMGKVLIEKLLRSCPQGGTIYVLIRQKKGQGVQERTSALLASKVFDVVRKMAPDFASKVVGVAGDISSKGLGMSAVDRARIIDEVSVIFHIAATVRFDAELNEALGMNINSVKEVIDICRASTKLAVAVYVSTAYSNCPLRRIGEQIYPPPLTYGDINDIVEISKRAKWSKKTMDDMTRLILGDWPNTYTFTKAIAENTVAEHANGMPFAIFRPSIVLASLAEPFAGWLDNMASVNGVTVGIGCGIMHAYISNFKLRVDLVPVDMACNGLLACAWETAIAHQKKHQEEIPVYNYVCSPENPITWNQLDVNTNEIVRAEPFDSAVYYKCVVITQSEKLYTFLEFFLHTIPAFLVDNFAGLLGKRPGFRKMYRKVGDLTRRFAYFSRREWTFENVRVQNLWESLNAVDKSLFPFSMRNLDWKEHARSQIKGAREFLLGETEAQIPRARRRQFFLYVVHTLLRAIFSSLVLLILWEISCRCG